MSETFLEKFQSWGVEYRSNIDLEPYFFQPDKPVSQAILFKEDLKSHIYTPYNHIKYEVLSLAQYITTIVLAPFALFIDLCRLCTPQPINATTVLKNIYIIPKHIFLSAFQIVLCIARVANKTVSALSIGVGFLAWHGGEWLVRNVKTCCTHGTNSEIQASILSDYPQVRDIVYRSIGMTLIAAGVVFIPILPIQLIALPIIMGSIYGTINNQFTIRECPEYYTMGHHYDGTHLRDHAVKTNNLIIKPIVTGCYATTMVTKIAGVVLAVVGALPYTPMALPITVASGVVGAVVLISLVTGHIFATMKKNKIQAHIEEYAKLIGVNLTDEDKENSWHNFKITHEKDINAKRMQLQKDANELKTFNERIQSLDEYITSNILREELPIKYITGWAANNTRNLTGYIFAGGGTLVLAVATVFLRIYAL